MKFLLECTQEEGDIFIVPEMFHHAVINLSPIVAIGYQMNEMITPAGTPCENDALLNLVTFLLLANSESSKSFRTT